MISKKEVKYIADLARIELTEDETQKYERELSGILEFVEKLNEVDTKNLEPMAGGTSLVNITRADEQEDKNLEERQAMIIGQVPARKDKWVQVKAIFE